MGNTSLKKTKQGYGYKYVELSAIHEYLEENNLRYYQFIKTIDGNDYIMTQKLRKSGEEYKPEGEAIQGCRVVQAVLSGKSNPAQEQGSALTYARRYSLLMAYGLSTEDDDGESLTKTKISKQMVEALTDAIRNKGYMKSYVEDVLSKYGCKTLNDINQNDLQNIKKDLEI